MLSPSPPSAHGSVDVSRLDRQATLEPLIKAGQRLVGDCRVVGVAGDRELIAPRAQLHASQLLDAHEIAIVISIQQSKQRIVVERHAAHVAGAAARRHVAHAATS
jgi:hypothetical protein